jgi:hypothetical protein
VWFEWLEVGEGNSCVKQQQLKHADKDDIGTTKKILSTLMVAFGDPTLEELCVLPDLDVDIDADEAENEMLKQARSCGPLLRVYDTDELSDNICRAVTRVNFIHPLARDSPFEPDLRKLIGLGGESADGKTEEQWQHGVVGLRCFSYMLDELGTANDNTVPLEFTVPNTEGPEEAETDALFVDSDNGNLEDDGMGDWAMEYPLKHWLHHGHEETPDFVDTLDIKHGFWSLNSVARRRWWGSYARKEVAAS